MTLKNVSENPQKYNSIRSEQSDELLHLQFVRFVDLESSSETWNQRKVCLQLRNSNSVTGMDQTDSNFIAQDEVLEEP